MTDPNDCLELSPFGPFSTDDVVVPPAHPEGAGYGGSSYGLKDYGDGTLGGVPKVFGGGYGREGVGFAPYGGGVFPATPFAISGGYGGDPYGFMGFGSKELGDPRVSSAISISGTQVEVFFTEPMDPRNPALSDPASYDLIALVGAETAILSVSVGNVSSVDAGADIPIPEYTEPASLPPVGSVGPSGGYGGTFDPPPGSDSGGGAFGVPGYGSADFVAVPWTAYAEDADEERITSDGVTSIILTHLGTTLGGTYKVKVVVGITDIAGNEVVIPTDIGEGANLDVIQSNEAVFFARGDAPTYTVTPVAGDRLLLNFSSDMLKAEEFSPGTKFLPSYAFAPVDPYPVDLTVLLAEHPHNYESDKVLLSVKGMTSIEYGSTLSPASAISYDGSYLPNESSDFSGSEVGTGSSYASTVLSMTKEVGDTYGWQFLDLSGRIIPITSTYRTDITFDAGNAAVMPIMGENDTLAQLVIADGETKLSISLSKLSGQDVLSIGEYADLPAVWSEGVHTITVIRNQKAGIYAFLFDGTPIGAIGTAFIEEPADFAGVSLDLSATYKVSNFRLHSVGFGATGTLYSSLWNFMHDVEALFTGSDLLTKDHLLTQRGPLVKGWGDATPATKQDVEVRVNDTPVEIAGVNPYTGRISTVIPIPKMPVGDMAISVDYKWFATPVMEMRGLNWEGLTLNKWDLSSAHHDPPAHGEQIQDETHPKGAPDTARFPMGTTLGPLDRRTPLHIGHRYLGFERAYTASLNSPVTLLLNQNPNSVAVNKFEDTPVPITAYYEGLNKPTDVYYLEDGTLYDGPRHVMANGTMYTGASHTPFSEPLGSWNLFGQDDGGVDAGQGTYTLTDEGNGEPGVAFYHRLVELTHPTTVRLVARFKTVGSEPHGVFTGMCFGTHNNRNLYLVGALEVPSHNEDDDPVQHIGLLQDGANPHLIESWIIGPQVPIEILNQTTAKAITSDLPHDLEEGARFQIFDGSQEGTYLIEALVHQTDGTSTITVEGEFPAEAGLWDNTYFTVVLESKHSETLSYVLTVDPIEKKAKLYVSGELSGMFLDLTDPPSFTEPALVPLLLNTQKEGQVFWGSVDRQATNSSVWSFFRYSVSPDYEIVHSQGLSVFTEMNALPQDNPNDVEWFREQIFGYSEIDATADALLLKSTSASSSADLAYRYTRLEPYLAPDAQIDVDAKFRVDSGILGAGDAQVEVRDTRKRVLLSALCYMEAEGLRLRRLVSMPSSSLSCLYLPQDDPNGAWEKLGALGHKIEGQTLVTTHSGEVGGQLVGWETSLDLSSMSFEDTGSRIAEARFAVKSFEVDDEGRTGITFQVWAGGVLSPRAVLVTLRYVGEEPAVTINQTSGAPIGEFLFDWTDGEFHTYRVLIDAVGDTVVLVLDDAISVPLEFTALPSVASNTKLIFGHHGGTAEVHWDSVSVHVQPPPDAKRTLGVWRGRDPDNINNWELPRIDSSTAPNSSPTGPVIEEMDWRNSLDIRIHRDPEWGVTILRTDLPPPPYFDGEWATDITSPSAGWINVEYRNLPDIGYEETFGVVTFGALDPRSVSQQRWESLRYRIYNHPTDDLRSPEHMILNQSNIITSGETTEDIYPEKVVLETLDSSRVSLKAAHIYASRIFKVLEGDTIIPSDNWDFDISSQLITLTATTFSDEHVTATIIFTSDHDVPTTETYLKSQPLHDSITLLNEGTPAFARNQTADAIRGITTGAQISYFYDVLNSDQDFVLNDPFKAVTFADDPESLYDSMKFFEISNDGDIGLLTTLCDDRSPAHGFREIALEGSLFQQQHSGIPKPDYEQYGGMPGTILFASGGNQTLGGNLAGGESVRQGTTMTWPVAHGGIDQKTTWNITLDQVILDATDLESPDNYHRHLHEQILFLGSQSDNVAPTGHALVTRFPDGIPDAPDGFLGIHNHGACLATMEQAAAHSRLGPWGGLSSLVPTPIPGRRGELLEQQIEVGSEEYGEVFRTGSLLYGGNPLQPDGIPALGNGMVLQGGAMLPDGSAHTFVLQSPDATPTYGGYGGDPYGGETEGGVGGGSGSIDY